MRHFTVSTACVLCAAMLLISGCQKSDAVSTDGKLRLQLPAGWDAIAPKTPLAKIEAHNLSQHGYVIVISEAKEDFSHMDLQVYADRVMANERAKTKMPNRTQSEPEHITINGEPALRYTVTGTLNGLNLVYNKTFELTPNHYNQVMCWTTPSNVDENRADFEFLASHLSEQTGSGG